MMKCFILVIAFFTTQLVQADSPFVIRPYLIIGDNQNVSLQFQTSKKVELSIKVTLESDEALHRSTSWFKKNQLAKIDLGTLPCGKSLTYEVLTKNKKIKINEGTFPIPCREEAPVYIGFMADTQIKNNSGQERANQLSGMVSDLKEKYPFSLLINAGDIVQTGGSEKEWVNFFNTANSYLKSSYLMSAVGNHEYYESEHMDQAPPEFMKFMRDEHAHELGHMEVEFPQFALIILNTNFKFMTPEKIQEQWDWLEAKLTVHQSLKRPVFISFHHSPFSSSLEWVRDIPEKLRNEFVPLVEQYSCVKAVLTGHLHMFERSFKNGIHYIVAGPSGGIYNPISYKNPFSLVIKPFVTTFTILELGNGQAKIVTYDTQKRVVDRFQFYLDID